MDDDADGVLTFWLNEVGPEKWYVRDDAVDRACARRFGALVDRAGAGRCDRWVARPRGALALMILLDQFPRNIHRGSAQAFARDPHARRLARTAIRLGHDRATPEPERQFFYLPLMHSESLAHQDRCVRLFLMHMPGAVDDNLPHAIKHRAVIRRFGRFPSRNAALGRADNAAELAYRAEGGYMS